MTLGNQRQPYETFKLTYNNDNLQIQATGYYRVFVSISTSCSWNTGIVRFITKKNGHISMIEA